MCGFRDGVLQRINKGPVAIYKCRDCWVALRKLWFLGAVKDLPVFTQSPLMDKNILGLVFKFLG